jgi:hypothetical protein
MQFQASDLSNSVGKPSNVILCGYPEKSEDGQHRRQFSSGSGQDGNASHGSLREPELPVLPVLLADLIRMSSPPRL